MTETQHLSEYGEDDDGFIIATCTCNQFGPFPAPDMETASDAFADHMREVGRADLVPEIARLNFQLGLAHGMVMRLIGAHDAADLDPTVWAAAEADAHELLSTMIESPTAEEAPNANRDQ